MTGPTDLRAPRPGFAAGFLPSFGRAFRYSLPGRRALVLIFVLAIPPLLSFLVTGRGAQRQGEALTSMVFFLYLQFLVPISGLIFGGGVLVQEVKAGNLPYLFTRPSSRASILAGRYAAATVVGCLTVGLSLAAMLVLLAGADVPPDFHRRAMAATLLAVPAYIALFTALSLITRWAMVIGFLYTFGIEGFVGFIPGMLRKWTILFYSRSFTGIEEEKNELAELLLAPDDPPTTLTCAVVLLALAAIGVGVSLFLVRVKEFPLRDSGSM